MKKSANSPGKKNKPLVSICIPNYNCEKYITEAIKSTLNQTYNNIEIIVIDNCSTDNSWKIIKSFDNKIKAIRNKKNIGSTSNFNKCIRLANGKYMKILHSDDVLERSCIEKQVNIMEKNRNVGFAYGKTIIIDEKNNEIEDISFYTKDIVTKGIDKLDELLCGNHIMFPSVMLRKKCVDDVGFFDPRLYYCNDWDLWMRICMKYDAVYLKETMAFYRIHSKSSWRAFEKDKVSGTYQLNCLNKIFSKIHDEKILKKKKYYYYRLAREQIAKGFHLTINGNPKHARKNIAISMKIYDKLSFKIIVCLFYLLTYLGKYPSLFFLTFGKKIMK